MYYCRRLYSGGISVVSSLRDTQPLFKMRSLCCMQNGMRLPFREVIHKDKPLMSVELEEIIADPVRSEHARCNSRQPLPQRRAVLTLAADARMKPRNDS